MNNLGHSLSLFFGGRRKIEAESKRLTQEHKKREDEQKKLEQERQKLEATFRHVACEDDLTLLGMMIDKMKVNINAQDPETGRTALIMAVDYERVTVVSYLLAAGAEVYLKANNGKTAVDIARDKEQMDIVRLLEETHRSNQDYRPR